MKEKIAFRADGSNSIGMGHIMESLAVAEALQNSGLELYFIMKNYPEAVTKVQEAGYSTEVIDPKLTEKGSFRKTIQILKEKETFFLVTNLLEIQEDYSSELKKNGIKCISLDIRGKINLKSDIIINRTTINQRIQDYHNDSTVYYLWPKFFPLRKQFIGLDREPRQINQTVRKVLLCFGGGDEYNLSARVAWILGNFSGISVTLVLGAAFKLEEELQEIIADLSQPPTIIKDAKNMKELFLQNDLVICAGGSILYELAVSGTPALIIPMNDHQVENAQEFEKFESVITVALHTEIEDQEIQSAIKRALDFQLRKKMSEAGKRVTDGRGAERIAEIISKIVEEKC